ncbi:MAG TPA: SDR family NAD(P)-dependent oxidoreductase [Vicinamibacteria bacterium]|nr:SDR family NAD(P)-dependent oxidoreductase [Vicinamibacteria bacterium]
MSRLEGKAALITGASRGLGRGLASVFVREGASVFLCARSHDALARAAGEIERSAGRQGAVAYFGADVGDPDEAQSLVEAAIERFPHLTILVNNASILGLRTPIVNVDVLTWDEVLRVNTSSLFYVTRPLLPHLIEKGEGSIINVSSSVGRRGKPNWGPYAVSKFGLEGFTQVLAVELEPHGIRVNSVNPGATRTEMRADAYPDEDPMTLPTPEDIAEVFVHLASDESRSVTGQALEARDYLKTRI